MTSLSAFYLSLILLQQLAICQEKFAKIWTNFVGSEGGKTGDLGAGAGGGGICVPIDGVDLKLFVNEWVYWCPYD